MFRKKCNYCNVKIDKGKELLKDVKDPVFVGTRQKAFCAEEHANLYIQEVEERRSHKSGGGCC